MTHRTFLLTALCLLGVAALNAAAAEPCQSGLKAGQRPGPYSLLVSTGPQRGKPHCFVCETADKPAVIVFARSLTDSLGKLARQIDQAVNDNKATDLRAWVTFLSDDHTKLDPQVVKWAEKHGLRSISAGVFEDVVGPPTYLIARDADVTVLLSVKQKVIANFAFRTGELTDEQIAAIVKSVPSLIEKK